MSTQTDKERMAWIDEQSHEVLLSRWRFAPIGDLFFQGEVGEHYTRVMMEKRQSSGDNGVSASKAVGWG